MSYRIDLNSPTILTPCSFVPSAKSPGKMLSVNEDGSSVCVQPDGDEYYVNAEGQRMPFVPANDPNFDSPWTQADPIDEFLVYRSSNGAPRAYRMVGA